QYCRQLANVDTQDVWREAEDALVVPTTDYALRQRLHSTMWRTANRLMMQTGGVARAVGDDSRPDSKARYMESGRRHGEMALAVLGHRYFDECPTTHLHPENYAQVLRRLDTFNVDSDWWNSLAKAGEEIGARWQALPGQISQAIDAARDVRMTEAVALLRK